MPITKDAKERLSISLKFVKIVKELSWTPDLKTESVKQYH